MITWTYKGKEYWESYGYDKGTSVSIRAYTNGKYMILHNGQIIMSGKGNTRNKAIEALESYLGIKEDIVPEKVIEHPAEEQVIQQSIEQDTEENKVRERGEDVYKLSYTMTQSPTEENCVVITINPLDGTTVKYTTNGKEVISSSKIYKGEFIVEKGTPINYTVFDSEKNIIDKGSFVGE